MSLHWDKVTSGERKHGAGFDSLAASLLEWNHTRSHSLIRIGDAGQVTESTGRLPSSILSALSYFQLKGNRAIVYIHTGPETNENLIAIMQLSQVAINVSRHGTGVAYNPDVPQVTTVPKGTFTEGRRKVGDIVQCPAEYRAGVTCDTCRLCALPGRSCVVGFTAHGPQSRKVEAVSR